MIKEVYGKLENCLGSVNSGFYPFGSICLNRQPHFNWGRISQRTPEPKRNRSPKHSLVYIVIVVFLLCEGVFLPLARTWLGYLSKRLFSPINGSFCLAFAIRASQTYTGLGKFRVSLPKNKNDFILGGIITFMFDNASHFTRISPL